MYVCGRMIQHLKRKYDFRKCCHHFAQFHSDTSLNVMRSVAVKIDEAAAIAAAEFSLFDQFKMKSKSHLYRNTYNTVIMGNAFVRMSYFEHHAAVAKCYRTAADWPWTLNAQSQGNSHK